ncbi:MAG: hypothetical protein HQ592_02170, partial [Planctomycetes bacterium]|nr:hypothetical protein [Planctomycetota bacterium]
MRYVNMFVLSAIIILSSTGYAQTTSDIKFTMPADGYVSLIATDSDGVVVRHLLNSEFRAKGEHTVAWDGLATPIWNTLGKVLEPGEYTWRGIYHEGIGLRLRGWAYHGPSDPWDISPTTYWGGDQALPVECVTDGDRIYLGWAGSEAGKALIACDLDHNVLWAAGYHFNGVVSVAVDGDIVYYAAGEIKRVSKKDGKPVKWEGRRSADLKFTDIWDDPAGMPTGISHGPRESITARNGKLYVSFANWTWGRGDITDWRSFLTDVVAGAPPGENHNPVSAAIWGKIDDRCTKLIKRFLDDKIDENEALKSPNYYTPDVRDVVVGILKGLLQDKTLVENADQLSSNALAQTNRRLIEKTYPGAISTMRTNFIAMLDGSTGKVLKTFDVHAPGKLFVVSDDLLYVMSERSKILAFDPTTGKTRVVIDGLEGAGAMTVDKDGEIYVSNGALCDHILVYSPEGKLLRTIGEKGKRNDVGPWNHNALKYVWGMAVDARGYLWAAETTLAPKRMSVWHSKTGDFVTEYFGPTHYGATGGAVNPRDPSLLVGEGAEFRIDPLTGRSKLLGMITDEVYHGFAR